MRKPLGNKRFIFSPPFGETFLQLVGLAEQLLAEQTIAEIAHKVGARLVANRKRQQQIEQAERYLSSFFLLQLLDAGDNGVEVALLRAVQGDGLSRRVLQPDADLSQNFFQLIQRLPPEVLGSNQVCLREVSKLAREGKTQVLEAVVSPDGQKKIIDGETFETFGFCLVHHLLLVLLRLLGFKNSPDLP